MLTLPRRRMLKRRSDFQRVYHTGKTFANRYFVLYVFESDKLGNKVGFAAGKKLGCAVKRNRVKRLLRESYRKNQQQIKSGIALLFIGRKAAVKAKCDAVEQSFLQLGKKAGIFLTVEDVESKKDH